MRAAFGVAGAEEDEVVWVRGAELSGDFEADALRGAGDEDDGLGGVVMVFVFCWRGYMVY